MLTKLGLMGIFFAITAFIFTQTHVLSLLISLEAMMLSMLLFLFGFLSDYSSSLFWFLAVLTLAACEAALGLSLLVSMLRSKGNDSMSSFSSNLLFALEMIWVFEVS